MRVLIVNTSEQTGGAAIAASRLCNALNDYGVKAKMMVRNKQTGRITVVKAPGGRIPFLYERSTILLRNGLSKRNLWQVDIANCGTDITQTKEFREADVIHLHWVNQGFLSLGQIEKILRSGKRVVWTMHDMWPVTSICHHSGDCERFHTHCHDCPLLRFPGAKDLSYKVFERKLRMLEGTRVTFVGCSEWITDRARHSALAQGQQVVRIVNPVNTRVFHPCGKLDARKALGLPENGRLIMFGSLKVTDKNKGIDYLVEACKQLPHDIGIVCVGKNVDQLAPMFQHRIYPVSYVSDERTMALLYSAVDAFVTPSLFENLPNTIAEAMSCGTPCVGFRVGGIPEMICHQQNGYVAIYKDASDLACGIQYVLEHPELGNQAQHDAARLFSAEQVCAQYEKVYEGK